MDFVLVLYLFNIEICLGLPYERMKDIGDGIFRQSGLGPTGCKHIRSLLPHPKGTEMRMYGKSDFCIWAFHSTNMSLRTMTQILERCISDSSGESCKGSGSCGWRLSDRTDVVVSLFYCCIKKYLQEGWRYRKSC